MKNPLINNSTQVNKIEINNPVQNLPNMNLNANMNNINNLNGVNSKVNHFINSQKNIPQINPLTKSSYLTTNYTNKKTNILVENEDCEEEGKEDNFVFECISSRKFSKLSEKDLLSNIIIIAKEQAGCRYLQQKIDDNPNFGNYELYPEIHDLTGELICDPFGNYLIQRLLESLTTDKINHFIKTVKSFFNFLDYSFFLEIFYKFTWNKSNSKNIRFNSNQSFY